MDMPKNIGQQNFLRYKLTSWCCKEKQNYGQDVNAGSSFVRLLNVPVGYNGKGKLQRTNLACENKLLQA